MHVLIFGEPFLVFMLDFRCCHPFPSGISSKDDGIGGSMAESFGKKTDGQTKMLHVDLVRYKLEGRQSLSFI